MSGDGIHHEPKLALCRRHLIGEPTAQSNDGGTWISWDIQRFNLVIEGHEWFQEQKHSNARVGFCGEGVDVELLPRSSVLRQPKCTAEGRPLPAGLQYGLYNSGAGLLRDPLARTPDADAVVRRPVLCLPRGHRRARRPREVPAPLCEPAGPDGLPRNVSGTWNGTPKQGEPRRYLRCRWEPGTGKTLK